jgi:hypothetical protein
VKSKEVRTQLLLMDFRSACRWLEQEQDKYDHKLPGATSKRGDQVKKSTYFGSDLTQNELISCQLCEVKKDCLHGKTAFMRQAAGSITALSNEFKSS